VHTARNTYDWCYDECHNGGAHTTKGGIDPYIITHISKEERHGKDNEE
jgi:hypothetical protein